ncbi:hypothetical protein [Merismopedia glauca]|nr:hypothetical protein [Merismopedia glauca]
MADYIEAIAEQEFSFQQYNRQTARFLSDDELVTNTKSLNICYIYI